MTLKGSRDNLALMRSEGSFAECLSKRKVDVYDHVSGVNGGHLDRIDKLLTRDMAFKNAS